MKPSVLFVHQCTEKCVCGARTTEQLPFESISKQILHFIIVTQNDRTYEKCFHLLSFLVIINIHMICNKCDYKYSKI